MTPTPTDDRTDAANPYRSPNRCRLLRLTTGPMPPLLHVRPSTERTSATFAEGIYRCLRTTARPQGAIDDSMTISITIAITILRKRACTHSRPGPPTASKTRCRTRCRIFSRTESPGTGEGPGDAASTSAAWPRCPRAVPGVDSRGVQRLVRRWLPVAAAEPEDSEAREQMP